MELPERRRKRKSSKTTNDRLMSVVYSEIIQHNTKLHDLSKKNIAQNLK